MPICVSLAMKNATEMHECGLLCTKFMVPSIGSITHVGASVNSVRLPSLLASSPMNLTEDLSLSVRMSQTAISRSPTEESSHLWCGNWACNPSVSKRSISLSLSVTRSTAVNFCSIFFCPALRSTIIYG